MASAMFEANSKSPPNFGHPKPIESIFIKKAYKTAFEGVTATPEETLNIYYTVLLCT